MAPKTTLFDPADYLTTAEHCTVFLTEAPKSNDATHIGHALGVVARARGMTDIARKTRLSRDGLYKTPRAKGHLELTTVLKVLGQSGSSSWPRPAAKARRGAKPKTTSARHKAASPVRRSGFSFVSER